MHFLSFFDHEYTFDYFIGKTLIWDSEGAPPSIPGSIVYWRSFVSKDSNKSVSVPQLVEDNSYEIRKLYLAWLHDLTNAFISGKPLVDHFSTRSGFSYWWTTLLLEKSNWAKSPNIDDVIRFFAFDQWAKNISMESIVLITTNKNLVKCLKIWSQRKGIKFEFKLVYKPDKNVFKIRKSFNRLPHFFQAILWLGRYIGSRWYLRGQGLTSWKNTEADITFFSYLFNLDGDLAQKGEFSSSFWGPLPKALEDRGVKANWLHIYIDHQFLPTPRSVRKLLNKFNRYHDKQQVHVSLDSFLSFRVIFLAVFDWILLCFKKYHLAYRLSSHTQLPEIWPFFKSDFSKSLIGVPAIHNTLQMRLLESALQALPVQSIACYLQENIGWEFSLIQNWRLLGHRTLIGVPHSSIRYWDLRYFFDPRNYVQSDDRKVPRPDRVAVNGRAAMHSYLEGNYPSEELVEVEALRYLHLSDCFSVESPRSFRQKSDPIRLLVLGDYLADDTQRVMNVLKDAIAICSEDFIITLKPHPACPVNPMDYPEMQLNVVNNPIYDLVRDSDVAITSCVTAASLDAFFSGLSVISLLNPNKLNLSPLRGNNHVHFVEDYQELASALHASQGRIIPLKDESYFRLDNSLIRWLSLLTSKVN